MTAKLMRAPSAMDVDVDVNLNNGRPPSEAPSDLAEDEGEGRSTIGQCRKCHADIGEFFNSWIKVTATYYLPAMPASYRLVGVTTGKQRLASPTSSLSEW